MLICLLNASFVRWPRLRRIGKMKSLRVYRLGGKGKAKDKGQD